MKLRSLGYVGVESVEYKVWEDLGPRVFGFGLAEPGADGSIYLRLDDRHHRIALHPGEQDRLAYIGWEVAKDEDVDEAGAELRAKGVPVEDGTPEECEVRRVERMIYLRDPGGVRHEIFCGATENYKSFEPGRRHSGFVTGDQGLGHIVLVAPDGEAMHAFLMATLGFKLTDTVTGPFGVARFYHVNPRHHSLAVLSVPGMSGLHHIMVEVNDLDDVGIANDLVQERIETHNDLSYSLTLGRHSTDRMLSIYVDTPSGFTIEYGWGGLRVDDSSWTVTHAEFPAEVWGHKFVSDGLPGTIRPVDAATQA
jgi:extradiol dioxygenase